MSAKKDDDGVYDGGWNRSSMREPIHQLPGFPGKSLFYYYVTERTAGSGKDDKHTKVKSGKMYRREYTLVDSEIAQAAMQNKDLLFPGLWLIHYLDADSNPTTPLDPALLLGTGAASGSGTEVLAAPPKPGWPIWMASRKLAIEAPIRAPMVGSDTDGSNDDEIANQPATSSEAGPSELAPEWRAEAAAAAQPFGLSAALGDDSEASRLGAFLGEMVDGRL